MLKFFFENSIQICLTKTTQAHYEMAKGYAERWLPEICYAQIEKTLALCFRAFSTGHKCDSILVWKLIGDAFLLVRLFNKNTLKLCVPEELAKNGNKMLDRNECFKMAQMAYYNVIKSGLSILGFSKTSSMQ